MAAIADQDLACRVSAEDAARADMYALLSRLFYEAADQELLDALASADELAGAVEAAPLARSWRALQAAASIATGESVREEYSALFVAVGKPEVSLYASYHLTGFMMEEPLARLRSELARLGLTREASVSEPEDHFASLMDVMRYLILGVAEIPPANIADQKRFFASHIRPWYERLLSQLRAARKANFYRAVADVAESFFAVEAESFDIE